MDPQAFALREFDSLCKRSQEAGDMKPIVHDLIETLHNGFVGTDFLSSKLYFLGKNNPQLLRLLALFRSSTWGCSQLCSPFSLDYYRYNGCDHLLSFMCITKSYDGITSKDCFRLVLSVAPEAARFKEPTGKTALHHLVGNNPRLEIFQMIVVVANKGFERSDSILLQKCPRNNVFFGFACQHVASQLIISRMSQLDFSNWLDLLEYITEDAGVHPLVIGSYINRLSSMVYDACRYGKQMTEMSFARSKDLILKAACIEFEAYNGAKASSSLHALIWSAEYLHIGQSVRNRHNLHGSVLYSLLPQLIADPIESRAVDNRMNTLLHVASSLSSKWYIERDTSRGFAVARSKHGWTNLFMFLLAGDEAIASEKNLCGRLPIHVALAKGMSWEQGVEVLFEAYPSALHAADPCTRLLPFMTAATATFEVRHDHVRSSEEIRTDEMDAFTTTYLLLREDPSVFLTLLQIRSG